MLPPTKKEKPYTLKDKLPQYSYEELEKIAADRKGLLIEIEEWVTVCPICLIRLKDHPFEPHKKAGKHSDTCRLAKETDGERDREERA